jgi:probable addiction module antidote protein
MPDETRVFDIQNYIRESADQAAYLEAALEEGDSSLIAATLGDIARAQGVASFAKESGISREAIYKGLRRGGNPTLETLAKAAKTLGYRLALVKA